MRLLLFAVACFFTLLLIRFLQRASSRGEAMNGADKSSRPAASEEEIVDVRFEERRGPNPDPERKP